MDRERAETFLRLLVEAELRDLSPPPLHAGGATDFAFFTVPVAVRRAAGALIAVDALDVPTADAILTDVELALGLRQQGELTEPGHPAALPRLDGVRLVLLGLSHIDGQTWMNVLAIGYQPDHRHGLLGLDMSFPLTVWIRDSAGRWHATRRYAYSADDDREYSFTLQLAPPLTRAASWIDVLVAGPSAEARVRLPLEWHPNAGE